MGTFASFCALSRLGIGYDLVLLVAVKEWQYPWTTYVLQNKLWRTDKLGEESPFVYIGVGHCNTYGSIEAVSVPEPKQGDWWDYQFLVHEQIAEAVLGRSLGTTDEQLQQDVRDIVKFAFLARIELFGTVCVGAQFVTKNELLGQKKLHEATLKILGDRLTELKNNES